MNTLLIHISNMDSLEFIILMSIGFAAGYIVKKSDSSTLCPIPQQHEVFMDKYCGVHINKAVKYEQEECRRKK